MTDCVLSLCLLVMVTVTILVQSADFTELEMDEAIAAISSPQGVTVTDTETMTSSCLVASSFTWYGPTHTLSLSLSLWCRAML